jgi:predicted GIY-YIG superfamily endonuclease
MTVPGTTSFYLMTYAWQTTSLYLAWDESVHLVYTIKKEYSMLYIGYMQQCFPVGEIPTAHASRTNKHNKMQVEQLLNCSNSEGVVFYAFYENS